MNAFRVGKAAQRLEMKEQKPVVFSRLPPESTPVVPFTTPETPVNLNRMRDQIAHPGQYDLRTGKPPCEPHGTIEIRAGDRHLLIDIGLQNRLDRMAVRIGLAH